MITWRIDDQRVLLSELFAAQVVILYRVTVIVDVPRGYALSVNTGGDQPTVVMTDNPCPEYQLDLLDRKPAFLINAPLPSETLTQLCAQVAKGVLSGCVRQPDTALTPMERKLLRLSASYSTIPEVAATLKRSVGSVKNNLSNLYSKLGLNNYSDLRLYYFGALESLPYLHTYMQDSEAS